MSGAKRKCSVLALVDSGDAAAYAVAETAMLRALEHLRPPRTVVDLRREDLEPRLDDSPALVLTGQPGLHRRLSRADVEALRRAVESGVGLVNLDGEFAARWPGLFEPIIAAAQTEPSQAAAAVTTDAPHFVTGARRPDTLPFTSPVATWRAAPSQSAAVLLEDESGAPLVIAGAAGQGRIVNFCCAPQLWTFEHLGHGCGMDDVFWRALVWAARKPFAMLAMPPFVTVRIDDASGSASLFASAPDSAARRFAYIDELNHHGFVPNVGLFIDDIAAEDAPILRARWAARQAQFSPHAFRDPGNVARFQIYMRHDGTEYSDQELREHFARVDAKFAAWGITPSRTLNCHFYEAGINAVPFLRERGWLYMMTEIRFGKHYRDPEARAWFPRPYGHFGYILDEMPEYPEFFDALAQYTPPRGLAASVDFLGGKTTFWNESAHNDLDAAIEHGAAMIARGLDNLVFGVLMAHEQRIAALTLDEWQYIIRGIAREIADYEKIFVSYDEVSEYARARHGVDLARATYDEGKGALECLVRGAADRELLLHVFSEENGQVVRAFHRLPAGRDMACQVAV